MSNETFKYNYSAGMQDEVHRFAIGYHRNMRKKNTLSSTLLGIEGIGEKRAKALMKHFKSIEEMINADVDQLAQVPTITNKVAEDIYNFFRQKEKQNPDTQDENQ